MPPESLAQSGTHVLDNIFKARSVAVVGASPVVGTARNTLVRVLQQTGFAGSIYPVNPRQQEVEGLVCYPDLLSLPEAPDVALVITPAKTVAGIIAQCGEKSIPTAVVYSSGFEETESGRSLAADLARAAEEHGVVFLGANCQGVWSIGENVVLSFGAAAASMRTLKHAPIAVVSQSGALGGAIANHFQKNDIGCAYMVSVGNETQLDILDALGYVIEQDDVRVAALYIEGLRDGGRLLSIAERARKRGIQIVALKSGNSALGQSATASHTGKIASPFSIYSHVFEQAGVIAVDTLAELIAAAEALAFLPHPRAANDPLGGVSALSTSGGACALLADHSDYFGVPMAEFSPDTAKRLDELFPEFGRSANPADLTGQIRADPMLIDNSLSIVSGDTRTEALVMQFSSSGRRDLDEKGALFKTIASDGRLPMILSFAGEQASPSERGEYREHGILFSPDPAATIRTLSWLYQRHEIFARPDVVARPPLEPRAAPQDWAETMVMLAECGIGTPKYRILAPDEQASESCAGLAYPLAVKALPAEADHKTELGLVKLDVRTPEAVDAYAAEFRKILGLPDAGILAQEMIGDGVEVVLSCLRETDFGPILTIGLGGVGIELFRDVTHLALPVDQDQVRDALGLLKLWTLLQGYRGKPRADIDALVAAAVRLGDVFLASSEIAELEINPLMVRPDGDGVVAVDALVALVDPR
ncbi:MAG: acetate--CoA ligase family protein [Alphaproteobacteria bacterium]|nr:acetate--CoA ligase family protein [Alphaproteobacteria bacterium]